MSTGVWLVRVCLLVAVSQARVWPRCELARTLHRTPMREQLALWVCIAYHESRLDTAAYNAVSFDHGLFQISELYWCNRGGAGCGLPCDQLRDDDIADDVECALQVHEEHTRLSGDGFSAWTVYNRGDCKNPKKFLADCELNEKHAFKSHDKLNTSRLFTQIDDLKAPYLAVKQLVQEQKNGLNPNSARNWYDFKIDNIDELKLPVFQKTSVSVPTSTTTTAAPTTTTAATTTTRNVGFTSAGKTPKVKLFSFPYNTLAPIVNPATVATPAPTAFTTAFDKNVTRFGSYFSKNVNPVPSITEKSIFSPVNLTSVLQPPKVSPFKFTYHHRPSTTIYTSTSTVSRIHVPSTYSVKEKTGRQRLEKSDRPDFQTKVMPVNMTQTIESTSNQPAVRSTTARYSKKNTTKAISEPATTLKPHIYSDGRAAEAPKRSKSPWGGNASVFELYLSTVRPSPSTYSFAIRGRKLSIFNGGTTTPLPSTKIKHAHASMISLH